LAKTCLWYKELQQAPSIQLDYNAFKTRERLHGQDSLVLEWIEKAGRLMLQGRYNKTFEIVIRSDAATSVSSHSDFMQLLMRPDVKGSLGPMTKRHGVRFEICFLPPPLERPWHSPMFVVRRPVYGDVYSGEMSIVVWYDWMAREFC
jgi:hypothetical protein